MKIKVVWLGNLPMGGHAPKTRNRLKTIFEKSIRSPVCPKTLSCGTTISCTLGSTLGKHLLGKLISLEIDFKQQFLRFPRSFL